MDFVVGRPDVVRAVNQRWLLNFWKSHLGTNRLPPWQRVVVEKLVALSANLSLLAVNGRGEAARFLVRFNGAVVGQIYGFADQRGKHLDEIVPPAYRADRLAPYIRTMQDGCPVYTIHDLNDRDGRLVHLERLLLPFSRDGQAVDRVLVSHELVCLDGAFDGNNLMNIQISPPALRLAATIAVGPQ